MDLKKIGFGGVDWIHLVLKFVYARQFIEQELRVNYYLLYITVHCLAQYVFLAQM